MVFLQLVQGMAMHRHRFCWPKCKTVEDNIASLVDEREAMIAELCALRETISQNSSCESKNIHNHNRSLQGLSDQHSQEIAALRAEYESRLEAQGAHYESELNKIAYHADAQCHTVSSESAVNEARLQSMILSAFH